MKRQPTPTRIPAVVRALFPALWPVLVVLLLSQVVAFAENEHQKQRAPAEVSEHHVHPPPDQPPSPAVGLEEMLGAALPLDVTFRDETGAPVTLGQLLSVPTIIAPVYYGCPNVCSLLQSGLARVLSEIRLTPGRDFQVISLSFDETETPALAARSKTNYLATAGEAFPPAAWHFLTGDSSSIRAVTDAAGFRFQRQGADFLHPVAILVVSAQGRIVRYLYGTRFLPMDLTLALTEAEEGRIGSPIRKVLSYCFSYDAENKRYVFNLLRVSGSIVLLTLGGFLAYLVLGRKKRKDEG